MLWVSVCVCVCVCARACVCVPVCVCVYDYKFPSSCRHERNPLSGRGDWLPEEVVYQIEASYWSRGTGSGVRRFRVYVCTGAHPQRVLLPAQELSSQQAEGAVPSQPSHLHRVQEVWISIA